MIKKTFPILAISLISFLGDCLAAPQTYFAQIDQNGKVLRVVVADQSFIDSGALGDPKSFVQTSKDGSLRGNYAGVGYTYDSNLDAFIPPKPYQSWVLDSTTKRWTASTPSPGDNYYWDETSKTWLKSVRISET